MLWKGVDPEYRREIDGIVAGLAARHVRADRWDIGALNAAEELPYYYVPWLDKKQGKPVAAHSPGNCSALIATGDYTRAGRIVSGDKREMISEADWRWLDQQLTPDVLAGVDHLLIATSVPFLLPVGVHHV